MGTRIRIMDLEVDMLSQETLEEMMVEYLSNDYLNIVHMISLDYIDTYDKNELVQQELSQADLVLPGEKAILSAHHVDVLETGGMVVDYRALRELFEPLDLKNRTFYLVLKTKKEAKNIYRYLARHLPKENIVGVFAADGEVTEEALVNDINTKLPDIIILSMESTQQEEWLNNYKGKINAKLCMVAGSIMPIILRENVHVPDGIRKLHLSKLYRWLVKFPYSHSFRKRIFNRKMDDYITKKNSQE